MRPLRLHRSSMPVLRRRSADQGRGGPSRPSARCCKERAGQADVQRDRPRRQAPFGSQVGREPVQQLAGLGHALMSDYAIWQGY